MILFTKLKHLVNDLALFKSAVSNSRKHGIPIMESVFIYYYSLEFRLGYCKKIYSLTLTILDEKVSSFCDILFLKFISEPLIDLVFG